MSAPPVPLSDTIPENRKGFYHGIFTTALEGGIGYWSYAKTYVWMKPPGTAPADSMGYRPADIDNFHAVLVPGEDDEWGIWGDERDQNSLRVDLAVIHRGVELFTRFCNGEIDYQGNEVPEADRKPLREGHYWHQFFHALDSDGDDGDFDAEVADSIVQFGLFGQLVFG